MDNILSAKGIVFSYFDQTGPYVLDNINLELQRGSVTLLSGKSGCGKSTLAYVLAGLYPEHSGVLVSGSVLVDGIDIHKLTPRERVAYVGMMFQNCDLQFCMDILRKELEFCGENISVKVDAESIARRVGVLDLLDRNFYELSGGEKQKCAFCCILAINSKVVILDEAFANVDEKAAKELIGLIRKSGLTVLAIDHNIDLWEGAYDRIIHLGEAMPLRDFPSKQERLLCESILETRGLSVGDISYPDISVKKGSITALLGKSGAGKTTFFNAVIGKRAYKGSLVLEGKEVKKTPRRQLFSICGMVFQNPANQFVTMKVFDEVYHSVSRWSKTKDTSELTRRTNELLALFQLQEYATWPPYRLSQGQQRRLAVLLMSAGGQEILLLDEPTYGQDFENICAIMALLEERAKAGLTVIMNTHSRKVAVAYTDQIIEIDRELKPV